MNSLNIKLTFFRPIYQGVGDRKCPCGLQTSVIFLTSKQNKLNFVTCPKIYPAACHLLWGDLVLSSWCFHGRAPHFGGKVVWILFYIYIFFLPFNISFIGFDYFWASFWGTESVTAQMKACKQYFPVVLLIIIITSKFWVCGWNPKVWLVIHLNFSY